MRFYRDDARARLAGTLKEHLVEAAIPATDTDSALKEMIDDGFLTMGVAYSALSSASVDDAEVPQFLVVLEIAGLRRILKAYQAIAYDPDVDSAIKLAYSKRVEVVERELARAEATLVARTPVPAFSTGVVTLGYLTECERSSL